MDGVSVGGGGGGGGRPLAGWLDVWLDWLIGSACGGQRLLGRATDGWVRDGRWWRGLLLGVADMPSMDVKLGRDCPGACGAAVVARSSRHVFFPVPGFLLAPQVQLAHRRPPSQPPPDLGKSIISEQRALGQPSPAQPSPVRCSSVGPARTAPNRAVGSSACPPLAQALPIELD